jgi:hypothetical protein
MSPPNNSQAKVPAGNIADGLPPPEHRLNQMLLGQFVARSLALAADLAIADLLRSGPLPLGELATRTQSNPDALYRVLRALAAVDVFEERPGPCFANTELSECLRTDVVGSMAPMARWLGDLSGWTAWGRLDHSVRTGEPAFDAVHGVDCFSWLQAHPESLHVFQEAMTGYSGLTSNAVADAFDFSSIQTLLDVGGGHGSFLSQVLRRNPALSGILFDRPEVIEQARARVESSGEAGRIRLIAGNFLTSVPGGADAIVLKHILHDWADEPCATLLGHCRSSLPSGGRLLVVESVLSDHPEAAFAKFLDLEMMVVTPGGRERTADEFARLFARAGFELSRVVPTRSPVCVVEAVAR